MIAFRLTKVHDEIVEELARLSKTLPGLPLKAAERISQAVKVDTREKELSGQTLGIQSGETRQDSVFYKIVAGQTSVTAQLTSRSANIFENFKDRSRKKPWLSNAGRRFRSSGLGEKILSEILTKVAAGAKLEDL